MKIWTTRQGVMYGAWWVSDSAAKKWWFRVYHPRSHNERGYYAYAALRWFVLFRVY